MRWCLATLLTPMLLGGAAGAETIAIVHGRIHSIASTGVIEDGTILIQDDRIVAVGRDVAVPRDALVFDADGAPVTPGLFSAWSQLGLVEVETVPSTQDQTAANAPVAVGFDVRYGLNAGSTIVPTARAAGVTRGAVFPLPGDSVFAGTGALVHAGTGLEMLDRTEALLLVELGATGARIAGGARGAAWAALLSAFDRASSEARVDAVGDSHVGALRRVLSGDMPLVAHAERTSDILNALALPRRYPKLRLVLLGAAEGWRVAPQIARAGVPVIVDSYDNLPTDFEKLGATQQNVVRLASAGVQIAIAPLNRFSAGAPHDARLLAQFAGHAVGSGLAWADALQAITLNPARIFGVSDRFGSLEAGKMADVVIWTDDPLEIGSRPTMVFIAGKSQPLGTRHTQLRDRYRDLADPRPFQFRP